MTQAVAIFMQESGMFGVTTVQLGVVQTLAGPGYAWGRSAGFR